MDRGACRARGTGWATVHKGAESVTTETTLYAPTGSLEGAKPRVGAVGEQGQVRSEKKAGSGERSQTFSDPGGDGDAQDRGVGSEYETAAMSPSTLQGGVRVIPWV